MIRAEVLKSILFEVETLPPVRKQIFKMLFLEDLSTHEIAHKLNIYYIGVHRTGAEGKGIAPASQTRLLKKGVCLEV